MPTTLPNLPNLAGTNVTPNVPAKTLADTDITVINQSTSLGIGADRKVTLAQLKAHIVTPVTDALDTRLDTAEPEIAALQTVDGGASLANQWASSTALTSFAKYLAASPQVPVGSYMVSAAGTVEIIGGAASTLTGILEVYIGTDASSTKVGRAHKQYVSLLGSGNLAVSFVVPQTLFVGVPANTTFAMYAKLGTLTIAASDVLWFERSITFRRIV